ncbi:hypothetical protein ABVC67_06120 [Lactobacillus gasseri]|jgi:hypothetical protein
MKNIKIQKKYNNKEMKFEFYPKRFLIALGAIVILLILWKVVF